MCCTRCGGLIVIEVFSDLREEASQAQFQGSRCLNCGSIEDTVIRANRLHPMPPARMRLAGPIVQGRKAPNWLSPRRPESSFNIEP
jgi:hypothetical protein